MKLLLLFPVLFYFANSDKLTLHSSEKLSGCRSGNSGHGWREFNGKCYKILSSALVRRDEAQDLCNKELTGSHVIFPQVVKIESQAEQEFLSKYIFDESQNHNSIWLAATRHNSTSPFLWPDGHRLTYEDWAPGHPTAIPGSNCVQLSSKFERKRGEIDEEDFRIENETNTLRYGLWKNVHCNKKNFVVCQRPATATVDDLWDRLEHVLKNLVPIGFIYTQYPNQTSPQSLWPNLVWEEITSDYAGLFFRARGNGSAPFNEIQEQDAPRLTNISFTQVISGTVPLAPVNIPLNSASNPVRVGWWTQSDLAWTDSLSFFQSNPSNEVRPINAAIRIWKRTH